MAGSCKVIPVAISLLLIISQYTQAQVINNNGARVNITSGTFVTSKDAENTTGASLYNNGNLDLTGNFLNNGSSSGNGFYRLGGNWTNNNSFSYGTSTVIFNGSGTQTITRPGGETFYNFILQNSGAVAGNYLSMASNVTIMGTLELALGNIYTGSSLLYLYNNAASSLAYTSTTGSRVLGKFERGVGQQALYLFPLGTTTNYNPANITVSSLTTSGSVLSQFFAAIPGNNGLPLPDPPVEVADAFSGGYWRFTPNGFSTSNFNINLDAAGFADTVRDVTRLIKRVYGGNWTLDGVHGDAIGTVVYRNNLTGDLDPAGTEFALGRERPLVTVPPVNVVQCEHTNAIFSVTATGATPFKYQWYKDGIALTNSADYSGTRTATLTVIDINLVDDGNYYCVITDKYRNSTTSPSASLVVMKIPVATATNNSQQHVCSTLPIDNIVLGLSYYDPGTTFLWTRDNPTGISTAIPSSGTFINIGDYISGIFDNATNAPVTVTFTITPKGPGPTFCLGNPITATVRVNPHPIASPLNNLPAICTNTATSIVLMPGSTMTQGAIIYDFTVTNPDGSITGNFGGLNNQVEGYNIARTYLNSSDTIKSVIFHIKPKNPASGCPDGTIVDQEVKVHAYPIQALTITKPLLCDGGSDASIRVTTSKGAGSYFVNWMGPNPLSGYGLILRNGLRKGRYDIDVTDNLGCISYNTDYIVVSGAKLDPVIDVATKPLPSPGYQTSCWYSNDGELSIYEDSPSTGVAPFTYKLIYGVNDTISSGTIPAINTPVSFTGLRPGNYKLLTFDKNKCKGTTTGSIIPPDTIRIAFAKKPHNGYDVSCKGYNDGLIRATVTGGNGIYTYKWTTPDGSFTGPDNLDSLTNVTAGTYYLTVTDQVSCIMTKSVQVYEPAGMVLQSAATKLSFTPDSAYNIACSGGNTGSIDITVNGGTLPYTYFWTDSASYTATTEDISGLKAGTYVVKVTDKNGCILKMPPLALLPSFGLTEPAPLAISETLSGSAAGGFNINCHGGNTGTITTNVTGGSGAGYTYSWTTTNGSGLVAGSASQTSLTAGTYHLNVTDAYGCHAEKTFTLTDPPALALGISAVNITCVSPSKDNGSINLTVSGGVSPYTYAWSNGAITEDISGLIAGNYSVTVTDANGCTAIANADIKLPPDVTYTKKLSGYNGVNISCNGYDNGYIKITPTSGTAPFAFNWSNGSTADSIGKLTAGIYTVTITDAFQCTATENITLTEPGKLSVNVDLSHSAAGDYNISCAGSATGSIELTPVNAVVAANYIWSDGSTSSHRTGLSAGEYTVIVTDANFCHMETIIPLLEPDSLKLSLSVSEPWCPDKPDGALSAVVTGGFAGAGYNYKWSDNTTLSAIAGIPAGDYSVTVTDQNNCIAYKSIKLRAQHESCLIIPNAISPNGDLINDKWNIGEIELYPNAEITIFNRWGESIWRSDKGYHYPWDGTSNGESLPIDSYHYVIDLHNGTKPIIGTVTIVR